MCMCACVSGYTYTYACICLHGWEHHSIAVFYDYRGDRGLRGVHWEKGVGLTVIFTVAYLVFGEAKSGSRGFAWRMQRQWWLSRWSMNAWPTRSASLYDIDGKARERDELKCTRPTRGRSTTKTTHHRGTRQLITQEYTCYSQSYKPPLWVNLAAFSPIYLDRLIMRNLPGWFPLFTLECTLILARSSAGASACWFLR